MSVQKAITRLGTRAVTELLTTLSALRVFVPKTDADKRLWTHSVEVAIASCRIAAEARVDVAPGALYLSALLHDVGRFMILEHAAELLGDVDESTVDKPEDIAHLERSKCGIDHAELGALAAVAWELPDRIVDFIGSHHRPFRRVDRELRKELQVLRLADQLTGWFHKEPLEDGLLPEEIDAYYARMAQRAARETRLTLAPERLAKVLPEIREDATCVVRTLGL